MANKALWDISSLRFGLPQSAALGILQFGKDNRCTQQTYIKSF